MALVRTEVSEELSTCIIRLRRISSETAVFIRATRRTIPEDAILQTMKKINVGKSQVHDIAERNIGILKRWETCANGKITRVLKKTTNDDDINIDKDVQTGPDTVDIDTSGQNFGESPKGREEAEEE
jgi:hypothetical protein